MTQGRVARSEWTKLHSLRSTRWSLLVAVVLAIGLPLLFAADVVALGRDEPAASAPTATRSTSPSPASNVSQLAIAVLGVLVITGEYSTGMIRASFTAVPKRLPVSVGEGSASTRSSTLRPRCSRRC